jgi:pilus assembly protein CpaE
MKPDRHVLVAAQDGELVAAVGRAVQSLRGFSLEIARPDGGGGLWGKAGRAAAVILEVDARANGAPTFVRRLAGAARDGRLVVAARGADAERVRALFRAGAADVIAAPFTPDVVQAALAELFQDDPAFAPTQGAVISVLKGCGGAGATTCALNLAAMLARGDEKRKRPARSTAVLDLDLQFGDADLALDLTARSTVVDVLQAGGRLDPRFLEGVMTEHDSGLKLLAAPPSIVPLDAFTGEFAVDLVDHAAHGFQRTLIDLPGAWTDWTLPILHRSDLILLVTAPTVAGAVGARRLLEGLKAAGVQTPVFLALNRLQGLLEAFDKPSRIGRSLEVAVDAGLRFDPAAVKAGDRGQLVVDAYSNGVLAKDLRACAAKLEGRLEALSAAEVFAELAA